MYKSKEKRAEYNKKWFEANKEKRRGYQKKHREVYKESINKARKLYYQNHREQEKKRRKSYYLENKNKMNKKRFVWWLKHNYGITVEERDRIIEYQQGMCPICGESLAEKKQCIDHNHLTGRVRGVLCNECNAALGFVKENVLILRNAIEYLEYHGRVI